MSQTKIIACTCEHPYQDAKYGKGKRIANQKKDKTFCCSVCKKIH